MNTLNKEKETLFVPLFGKAMESRKKNPILSDVKAEEIVNEIDYDFKSLKIPEKTNSMMCMRARLLDNFTADFLKEKDDVVVIHLGCGLDSRCTRIDTKNAIWYDLDFEEVIDIRKAYFNESGNYHLIASSVTKHEWINTIHAGHAHYLIIAEGLLMYLKEKEVISLLDALKKRLGNYTLIFDAFSDFAAQKANNHPSIRKTGAEICWGIDQPSCIETWDTTYKFVRIITFTSNEVVKMMPSGKRFLYKIADLFSIARNAQRILIYSCG